MASIIAPHGINESALQSIDARFVPPPLPLALPDPDPEEPAGEAVVCACAPPLDEDVN